MGENKGPVEGMPHVVIATQELPLRHFCLNPHTHTIVDLNFKLAPPFHPLPKKSGRATATTTTKSHYRFCFLSYFNI